MTIIVRCNFGKLAVAVSMTIAILFSAGRAIAQGSRIGLLKPTSAQKPAAISALRIRIGGLKNLVNSGDRCVIQT
ncbi:hypothetical protein [Mesorhizobium temperatum]|uniref:hypothetical protein n=1 Tax=Mesorhizobium temperatum TaxID=241416 RepID=UPI00117D10DE|nr:hypothetical protein [Mesorhizobium temperatum]